MPNTIEGRLLAAPYTFAILVSRFNEFVSRRLLDGALDCLRRHGASDDAIDIIHCPGAFEIPVLAKKLAERGKYDVIISLGCIIRGDTPHFDYIASAVSTGLTRVALETQVPVTFGVLTTDSLEQAIERAGAKDGNKGWEAALAAIELADLYKNISAKKK